jgi:DNA-binding NarL/FixJ family response regulator
MLDDEPGVRLIGWRQVSLAMATAPNSGEQMIRILIVTEIELIANVVSSTLVQEPDIEVIGCATSVDEALVQVPEADVILVSPRLPDDGALTITTTVAEEYPSTKVLAFGLSESRAGVLKYVEAGADGYVASDDSVDDLLQRIRLAHEDRAVVSPEIAAALMSRITRYAQLLSDVDSGLYADADLTPREIEVLELIAVGLSNQEIADRLVIELGTVKNHVHSILQKLNVSSREDAAAYYALSE